ncbi:hypothetical protein BESB_012010 [Besnoitia besnoiti]|uniref:Uncharacterized protein n=1 Tax=Besnoitia besnoiti TaxID=94643 RepID=A0A2A9M3R9_BESBE|nr:hypothetical protein BESB_012010 [Besnoitia besnoiti]PFH32589.1 hypothetical protein BESB_012010 [Besnoitia besnoiti]
MTRTASSLPQQGTLLAGVPVAAGPSAAPGRSAVPVAASSRRTTSASSFLSQRLGDSLRLLPQPSAAVASKRTRQFLQHLASSSSSLASEAQPVFGSPPPDSKAALLSRPHSSLRPDAACPVSDLRPAKQPKLGARACLAPVHSNTHSGGRATGEDFAASAFSFVSSGPLGTQPEKITPPPVAFAPGLGRARAQQAVGAEAALFASKSVLSLTSRNVSASRGSSPSPAAALLSSAKSVDGEKPTSTAVKNVVARVGDRRARPAAVAAAPVSSSSSAAGLPSRQRSMSTGTELRASSPVSTRLDFLNLAGCCRLVMCDTSDAFGNDFGVDNTHNSRLAQFNYDQAAYKADKAHPTSDYTATSKRISPETRDLLVCLLNQVVAHLAQNAASSSSGASAGAAESSGGEKEDARGKTTPGSADPLSPRAAATVAIAIQLFDRFMHVVHQNDQRYGVSAENRMHLLHGVNALAGTAAGGSRTGAPTTISGLLLNQLIAIACFCFADRVEAIHAYDYSTVLDAWKQQATGVLRQCWSSSSAPSSTLLKQKLMHIERKIISHVPPAGNVCVTPISELTEALLNVAVQFAHNDAEKRRRSQGPLGSAATPPCAGEDHPRDDRQAGEEDEKENLAAAPGDTNAFAFEDKLGGPNDADSDAAKKCESRLSLSGRETAASSRRCSSVSTRDSQNSEETVDDEDDDGSVGSSPFALRLRISGSNEPDMARLTAQLLVRLGQMDRRICLGFKPSIVASAACQIALLPQLSATKISPLSPGGRLAATHAFIASGASTGCRLVRRCQSMLLHKWLKVRNAMDALLASSSSGYSSTSLASSSPSSTPSLAASGSLAGTGCSIPDLMAAEWVLSCLTLSSHKQMLELLQSHAEVWAECAAANLRAKALAVGAPLPSIEAAAAAESGGEAGASGGARGLNRRRSCAAQPRSGISARGDRDGDERAGLLALPHRRVPGLSTRVGLYTITALQKELKRAERASLEERRLRDLAAGGEGSCQENRENA